MIISSRTPEGFPSECPLCGAASDIEFSEPGEDAPCPACGHLVWFPAQVLELLRRRFAETLGASDWPLDADMPLRGMLGADSLDMVELVMDLEEQFEVNIPDEIAQDIRTVGDLIRYLERSRRGNELG